MSERLTYLRDRMSLVLQGKRVRDLDEAFCGVEAETERLKDVLREARLQIEYLHEKFQETGSGNAVIAHINHALGE